jgi:hypothetical protein
MATWILCRPRASLPFALTSSPAAGEPFSSFLLAGGMLAGHSSSGGGGLMSGPPGHALPMAPAAAPCHYPSPQIGWQGQSSGSLCWVPQQNLQRVPALGAGPAGPGSSAGQASGAAAAQGCLGDTGGAWTPEVPLGKLGVLVALLAGTGGSGGCCCCRVSESQGICLGNDSRQGSRWGCGGGVASANTVAGPRA